MSEEHSGDSIKLAKLNCSKRKGISQWPIHLKKVMQWEWLLNESCFEGNLALNSVTLPVRSFSRNCIIGRTIVSANCLASSVWRTLSWKKEKSAEKNVYPPLLTLSYFTKESITLTTSLWLKSSVLLPWQINTLDKAVNDKRLQVLKGSDWPVKFAKGAHILSVYCANSGPVVSG